MKKRLVALMMVLMLLVGITACSSNDGKTTSTNTQKTGNDVQKTSSSSTLTVGFDQNFPPMGFVGDDGKFTGFDLELAKEVAKRLNVELKLQPISWDAKDMELKSKNIDCIWNGFTINGREDKYTWTDAYMSNNQVFVVKADSNIKTLADLKGKTVDVQKDSSAEAALKDKADLVSTFGNYIKADDYNTALMDLKAGTVDAVAMDEVVANYQIKKRGDKLTVLSESLSAEKYGVGFLLGNTDLRDKVQKALKDMSADGTLSKISNEWFGKDVTTVGK